MVLPGLGTVKELAGFRFTDCLQALDFVACVCPAFVFLTGSDLTGATDFAFVCLISFGFTSDFFGGSIFSVLLRIFDSSFSSCCSYIYMGGTGFEPVLFTS